MLTYYYGQLINLDIMSKLTTSDILNCSIQKYMVFLFIDFPLHFVACCFATLINVTSISGIHIGDMISHLSVKYV